MDKDEQQKTIASLKVIIADVAEIAEGANMMPVANKLDEALEILFDDSDGLRIRAERERERQYKADQLHITFHFCNMCGTSLIGGHCPHGCLDNSTADAIMAAYPPRPQIETAPIHTCPICGAHISGGFLCICEEPITSTSDEHIVNGQA